MWLCTVKLYIHKLWTAAFQQVTCIGVVETETVFTKNKKYIHKTLKNEFNIEGTKIN